MRSAIEIRRTEKAQALKLARRYVCKLRRRLGSLSAFVYGSFARGDFNAGSDIDIVVVSDSLPGNVFERLDLLYKDISGGIEPKGYTKGEFLRLVSSRNPLTRDVIEHGICLSNENHSKTLLKQG